MKLVFHKPYAVASRDLIPVPKDLRRDPDKIYLARPAAVQALEKMGEEAKKENVEIVVISAHRTFDFQKAYFVQAEERHGKGKGALWVAPAGYSEHHTGYVFDLADKSRPETDDEPAFEATPASKWLAQNARRFGFELSFPPANWQSVSYEPWHWRFAGDKDSRRTFHPSIFAKTFVIIKSMLKAAGIISLALLLNVAPASAEKVSFQTSDGISLEGDFLKPAPGKPTVILLHGYMSVANEWEAFAKYCNAKGVGVFYYDMRGHGKSKGSPQDFKQMVFDLGQAVHFLNSKYKIPVNKIGVGGASIGANIAFRHAAGNRDTPFAVLLSPGLNYQGLTTDDLMEPYGKRPLLLAASEGDRYAFYTINTLERLANDKSRIAVFREAPSAGHGVQMFRRLDAARASKLERDIEAWIEKIK